MTGPRPAGEVLAGSGKILGLDSTGPLTTPRRPRARRPSRARAGPRSGGRRKPNANQGWTATKRAHSYHKAAFTKYLLQKMRKS